MSSAPPSSYEDVVEALADALADGAPVTEEVRRSAARLADAAGVRRLAESLANAERILCAGEGFHSIERFFVDGSDEQRYLIELHQRSQGR